MDGNPGTELRRLRLLRGLALAEVARRAGVTRPTLRRWESGETPRGEGLVRLLNALKADAEERSRVHSGTSLRTAQLDRGIAHGPLGSPVHLGQALRALRFQTGRSQAEVAARLGTTQATVARWETGRNAPEMETLERLLVALRTTKEEAEWVRGLVDQTPTEWKAPEEASAWLRENRPSTGSPSEARMLAVEGEAWRRAARDQAWRSFLVEVRSWRAIAHQYAGNHDVAWETSESAKRLAACCGAWSEASVAWGHFRAHCPESCRLSLAEAREYREKTLTLEAGLFALQERAHIYRTCSYDDRRNARGPATFRRAESLYLRIVQEAEISFDPLYNRTVCRADGWAGLTTLYADHGAFEKAIEAYARIQECGASNFDKDIEALQDYLIAAHVTGARPMPGTLETMHRQRASARVGHERRQWERCALILGLDPLPPPETP